MNVTEEDLEAIRIELNQANKKLAEYKEQIEDWTERWKGVTRAANVLLKQSHDNFDEIIKEIKDEEDAKLAKAFNNIITNNISMMSIPIPLEFVEKDSILATEIKNQCKDFVHTILKEFVESN